MWAPAEVKIAHMDANKAKQAERLGMGIGRTRYLLMSLIIKKHMFLSSLSLSSVAVSQKSSSASMGSSHSASAAMNTVEQVAPTKSHNAPSRHYTQRSSPQYDMYDDFGMGDQSR